MGIVFFSLVPATLVHILIEKPFINIEVKLINPKPKKVKIMADSEIKVITDDSLIKESR